MNFKPNEFFLGLVDFITILLPGSLLAAILLLVEAQHTQQALYSKAFQTDTSTVFWVAFVFASFGIGYFLSSFASGLDNIYDIIRKRIYPYEENIIEQLKRPERKKIESTKIDLLEKDAQLKALRLKVLREIEIREAWEKIRTSWWRKALLLFFETEWKIKQDESFKHAKALFEKEAPSIQGATNTYKWSQAILDTWYPGIAEQINRTMAASKFFRSLVIVALLLLVFQLTRYLDGWPLWPGIVLLVLSFREYIVQRNKSTQMAYRSIVTLFYAPERLRDQSSGSGV